MSEAFFDFDVFVRLFYESNKEQCFQSFVGKIKMFSEKMVGDRIVPKRVRLSFKKRAQADAEHNLKLLLL